jgi:phosphoribosylanthranilate isomerase
MLIKICGLRQPEHALAAIAAGADLIGLVFAPSRRQISLEEAAMIVRAVRSHGYGEVAWVGLFVNATAATINEAIRVVGLDLVQLSGDEWPALAEQLSRPAIAAIRMDGSDREAAWLSWAQQKETENERSAQFTPSPAHRDIHFPRLLIDAHVAGSYGGTGTRADWARAAELAQRYGILLAGGLNPDNVAAAIQTVQPQGVDVSSGVETDGVKDIAKIEAFIGAARS